MGGKVVTVVNTPPNTGDSGAGWIVGVVLLILLVLVVLFWGGPLLRRVGTGVNETIPAQIDVNVEGGEQSANDGNAQPVLPDINIDQNQESGDNPTTQPNPTSTGSSPLPTGV